MVKDKVISDCDQKFSNTTGNEISGDILLNYGGINRHIIEIIDTKNIDHKGLTKVNNLQREIWGDGTGEFLVCSNCNHVSSKKDIFGHLSNDEFSKNIVYLLESFYSDFLPNCNLCGGVNRERYGEIYINTLRQKYKKSIESFLVVLSNSNNDYVGFSEGYTDSFENIYRNDLHVYFSEISMEHIRKQINLILGEIPNKLTIFSGVGIVRSAHFSGMQSMKTLFLLLNTLFRNMRDHSVSGPGIMMLDKNHVMFDIFSQCGGIALDFNKNLIKNLPNTYSPELFLFNDPIYSFCKELNTTPSLFFKKLRKNLSSSKN